ncbi:unnamed protein product [Adineta steineri]|uniref:Flavin-containing monooxygenase n=1 Tax=Adineta steineri TaxID=433720 RepID=A0A814X455_9BILA|nr:unnamed protein product [Adineta steineri]CAF1210814.1 unnamed protein product [Adineta steineri]CAF3682412.1 unnamed protein product [Adineta steineri]CAF4084789.1 unnamed protein product [Adineta steineri]
MHHIVDSDDLLQTDLIICATGYVEKFPFLSRTFHRIIGQNTTEEGVDLDLYRRIIPFGVPNIAFIGLPASLNTWMFFKRPTRLANVHYERQEKAANKATSIWHYHWYFGFTHTILLLLLLILFIWFFF